MIKFKCKYPHMTRDCQFSFSFSSTRFFCCLLSGKLYRMKLDNTGQRQCSRHTQRSLGRLFCPALFRKLFLWHKRTARGCVYTYRGWCVVAASVLSQGLPRWASGEECVLMEQEDMSSVQTETKKPVNYSRETVSISVKGGTWVHRGTYSGRKSAHDCPNQHSPHPAPFATSQGAHAQQEMSAPGSHTSDVKTSCGRIIGVGSDHRPYLLAFLGT